MKYCGKPTLEMIILNKMTPWQSSMGIIVEDGIEDVQT